MSIVTGALPEKPRRVYRELLLQRDTKQSFL